MSQQNYTRRNQRNPMFGANSYPQYYGYNSTSSSYLPQIEKDRSDILMQYINLLLENQKFMLSKFDHLETVMSRNTKENILLREQIEILDDRTKMLADKLEHLCEHLASDDDYDDNHPESEIGDDNYDTDDEDECECDHNDGDDYEDGHVKIIPSQPQHRKKKSRKGRDDGITIKVQDELASANPLELLFGLTGLGKPKEKVELSDSDDDYDKNEPVYDETETQQTENEVDPTFIELNHTLNNIDDLIKLGTEFEDKIKLNIKQKKVSKKRDKKKIKLLDTQQSKVVVEPENDIYELEGKTYSINLEVVSKLIKPLKKLSNIIGMKKVKEDIFEMIIYYLQGFEKNNKNMLHSVIEGPPGVGKTKLGKTLAQIYCALGIIPSSKFKYVKATDLIGDHVGATKHMTQAAIDEADGGVLFIDEAYALSSNDNKDPYGKECIDTLNFNLSENKKNLIVIIAGYAEQLEQYFFSYNPGLQRRFPFRYKINGYDSCELRDIFLDKLRKFGWKLNNKVTMEKLEHFFKNNKDDFTNFGGDIENFFKNCQFAHSRRIIGKNPQLKKKLTDDDLELGLKRFKNNKKKNDNNLKYTHMYL